MVQPSQVTTNIPPAASHHPQQSVQPPQQSNVQAVSPLPVRSKPSSYYGTFIFTGISDSSNSTSTSVTVSDIITGAKFHHNTPCIRIETDSVNSQLSSEWEATQIEALH